MSLRINTNVAALNAYNNLSMNQSKLDSAFSQLSSGLRINKAADDSSGLAISQGLTSQINGLTQAVSNAQDATNVAQIADGALGTTQDILQRMHTLVLQAANTGTQDATSESAIQQELGSLSNQLDSISSQTSFGTKKLLDGTYNGAFQIGANGGQRISLALASGGATGDSFDAADLGVDALSAGGGGTIDVSGWATSGTVDADSQTALTAIETALNNVSSARAGIGATQNQLAYTVTNLQTAVTNVTASKSNLTDADLATQVTMMTQEQILTSAATSVLSQANSAPQAILKLLQ